MQLHTWIVPTDHLTLYQESFAMLIAYSGNLHPLKGPGLVLLDCDTWTSLCSVTMVFPRNVSMIFPCNFCWSTGSPVGMSSQWKRTDNRQVRKRPGWWATASNDGSIYEINSIGRLPCKTQAEAEYRILSRWSLKHWFGASHGKLTARSEHRPACNQLQWFAFWGHLEAILFSLFRLQQRVSSVVNAHAWNCLALSHLEP